MAKAPAIPPAPIRTRPSDARRKALADEITVPTVSNFFPIERYYDAAEKVYESVTQMMATSRLSSVEDLNLCYVYGKRYCIFCLEAIPNHNYHGTTKYKQIQSKHMAQVQKVVSILELVADKMDQQEIELAAEALRQQQERERLEQEHLEQWQRRLQQQKQSNNYSSSTQNSANIQQSAMDKLKLLQQPQQQPMATKQTSSTRYRFQDDSDDDVDVDAPNRAAISFNGVTPLPPPMLLPPALPLPSSDNSSGEPAILPPSYDAVVQTTTNKFHPSFGPSAEQPIDRPEQPLPKQPQQKPMRMRQLQEVYRNMYTKYIELGKIKVFPIDTYQGRVSESTNGCTVISALIAARHLNNNDPAASSTSTQCSISNEAVQHIIDRQCGPILREIRRKLGLGGHALIIPSDVHDHLVDAKILHQEYFAGAAGGNVMDKLHYGEFIKLLGDGGGGGESNNGTGEKKKSNGKAAATLFFREHVISIVKFTESSSSSSTRNVTSKTNDRCRAYYDLIDSMPGISQAGRSMATRTRCADLNSLEVLLQWYASRKFSDSNCAYIDRNPWDDSMADLDPRVFQGFVWST